jgi:hypothetical protein
MPACEKSTPIHNFLHGLQLWPSTIGCQLLNPCPQMFLWTSLHVPLSLNPLSPNAPLAFNFWYVDRKTLILKTLVDLILHPQVPVLPQTMGTHYSSPGALLVSPPTFEYSYTSHVCKLHFEECAKGAMSNVLHVYINYGGAHAENFSMVNIPKRSRQDHIKWFAKIYVNTVRWCIMANRYFFSCRTFQSFD